MDRRSAALLRPPVIAAGLMAANLLLAAGLVALALRPRPVRVLPSATAEAELWPGAVPAASAREFALSYVLHLDNYTPATIEASTRTLKAMIAPRNWSSAAGALDRRLKIALEGRMGSQALPTEAKVDGLRVQVEALRRTFIADKLSRESRVTYELVLERQPATEPNPFGLGVVSQTVREEAPREP